MAQEILVKDPLEKEKIEAGNELVRRLTKSGLKVAAALWLWRVERPRWKLVIASPLIRQKGLRETLNRIDHVLHGQPPRIPDLELLDIFPMATTEPLIKAFRARAKKYHTDMAGERLKEDWLGNVPVNDAYVYFVK